MFFKKLFENKFLQRLEKCVYFSFRNMCRNQVEFRRTFTVRVKSVDTTSDIKHYIFSPLSYFDVTVNTLIPATLNYIPKLTKLIVIYFLFTSLIAIFYSSNSGPSLNQPHSLFISQIKLATVSFLARVHSTDLNWIALRYRFCNLVWLVIWSKKDLYIPRYVFYCII